MKCQPQICILGDFVFKADDIADHLYFILQGQVEILAQDNETPLAYQNKGSYFGEIGILLTGVRTASVRIIITSILFCIEKNELNSILVNHPNQAKFLRAVGRQRIKKISKEQEEGEQARGLDEAIQCLQRTHSQVNLFGDVAETYAEKNQTIKRLGSLNMISPEDEEKDFQQAKLKMHNKTKMLLQRMTETKVKPWLTTHYSHIQEFFIVPFSLIFNVWNTILVIACTYYGIIIPYNIVLAQDINIYAHAVCQIILIIDMPFRAVTAVKKSKQICFDRNDVLKYYMNQWLVLDFLATIPLDWITFSLQLPEINRWILILKLLKLPRLHELSQILKHNSSVNGSFATLIQLLFLMIYSSHISTCCMLYFAVMEYKKCSRFDCKTQLWYMNWNTWSITGPAETLSPFELYGQMFYSGGSVITSACFGDITPFAPSEQINCSVILLIGRVIIAFVCAEFSSYLQSKFASIEEYSTNINFIKKWMGKSGFPDSLTRRVTKFYEHMWKDFRGVSDRMILDDLPATLRQEIRFFLFGSILNNWEILKSIQNQGIRTALISKFELAVFPRGEYIIRINEIAQEMYFIIQGKVSVRNAEGKSIFVLEKGQYFGEMALLDQEKNSRRGASIYSISKVTLAVLKLKDFLLICNIYPEFNKKIKKTVEERQKPASKMEKKVSSAVLQKIIRTATKMELDKSQEQNVSQSKETPLVRGNSNNKSATEEDNSLTLKDQSKQNTSPALSISIIKSPKKHVSSNDIQKYRDKVKQPEQSIQQQPVDNFVNEKMNHLIQTLKQKQTQVLEENLRTKFQAQKVNMKVGLLTLEKHFVQTTKTKEKLLKFKKKLNKNNLLLGVCTILSFYNLIFVPMQFAWRIVYNQGTLVMEIFTITFYLLDANQRYKRLNHMRWVLEQKKEDLKDEKDLKTFELTLEQITEIRRYERIQIMQSLVASAPFSCMFSAYDYWKPWYIVNFYCSLRIVKIQPVFSFFEYLRSHNLNLWRAVEVIFYYYVITHYWSCMMVSMACWEGDANKTWLAKVPFPPNHYDKFPRMDFLKDNSILTAYIHAFYFLASCISHVNIGDVAMINLFERMCMPFIMIFGTWMYYLLYSNIVAMVASLAPHKKINFEAQYYALRKKLDNGVTPQREIDQFNEYTDYILAIYDGLDEQKFLGELPYSIKTDILLSRFSQAIERNITFKDQNDCIDITLVNSVFGMMQIKFYMKDQFLVRLGEHINDTIIILDGKVDVFGSYNNEFLGFLPAGYHYDNDLRKDFTTRNYYGHLGSGRLKLNLSPGDNLQCKSMVHLVAKSFVIVGVLKQEQKNYLYNAYPIWKKKMQCINYYLFDIGQLSLEKTTQGFKSKFSRELCLNMLENNVTYSTQLMYETFLEEFKKLRIDFNTDLSQSVNDFFQMEYYEHDDDPLTLMRRMKIVSEMNLNYDDDLAEEQKQYDMNNKKLKFTFEVRTNFYQFLQIIQFANLMYSAFFIPFQIGFNLEMTSIFVYIEGCSLAISLFFFCITFRIPVIVHRQKTIDCKKVCLYYWQKDMIFDLIGLCPLNLVLGIHYNNTIKNEYWVVFIALLRVCRVVQIYKLIEIVTNFQVHFKIPEIYTNLFKTFIVFMILSHFAVCAWMYTIYVLEPDEPSNWIIFMGLQESSMGMLYLRTFYCVQNIVTTTGSGDCLASTDLERCFFIGLITGGDILFSIAFGFVQSLTTVSSVNEEEKNFIDKIVRIESYMDEHKMNSKQKKRVEEYFAYAFVQKQKLTMLDKELVFEKLPSCLAKEIFYHNFQGDLFKMFGEFGSENFIRDLCSKLNVLIYLPGDYVIERGNIGREMYFVCDGLVNQIAIDNKTWVGRFYTGDYFGELGILLEMSRTIQMQAQTFCLLNELKKEDIDEVSKSYPKVAAGLRQLADEKLLILKNFKNLAEDDRKTLKFCGVIDKSIGDTQITDDQATFDYQDSAISGNTIRKTAPKIEIQKFSNQGSNFGRLLSIQDQQNDKSNTNSSVSQSSSIEEEPLSEQNLDNLLLDQQRENISDNNPEDPTQKKKERRLSGIRLGKTLKLSQKTGLKLHWAIDN